MTISRDETSPEEGRKLNSLNYVYKNLDNGLIPTNVGILLIKHHYHKPLKLLIDFYCEFHCFSEGSNNVFCIKLSDIKMVELI